MYTGEKLRWVSESVEAEIATLWGMNGAQLRAKWRGALNQDSPPFFPQTPSGAFAGAQTASEAFGDEPGGEAPADLFSLV